MTLVLGAEAFDPAAIGTYLWMSAHRRSYVAVQYDASMPYLAGLIKLLKPSLIICSDAAAKLFGDELRPFGIRTVVLRPNVQGVLNSGYQLVEARQ